MNVRSVTVFKKRMKQRRLATGSATKPILKVRKIARRRNTGLIRNVRRSVKAYYDQNRELILASKQAQYQANPKEKKSYEVGVYLLGAISKFIRAQGNGISFACVLAIYNVICIPPPPPPPPPPPCKLSTLCNLADGLLVGPFISEFCSVHGCYFINGNILHKCVSTGGPHQTDQSKSARCCMFIQAALVTP